MIKLTSSIVRRTGAAIAVVATMGAVAALGTDTASAATHPTANVNDVSVKVQQIENATMSHYYVRLVFTNTTHKTVQMKGYSGISFVAHGNGTQVGKPAVWLKDHSPKTIVLKPGAHTGELVRIVDPTVYGPLKGHSVTTDGFRVYIPGETRALFAPYKTTASTRNVSQLAAEPVGVTNQD